MWFSIFFLFFLLIPTTAKSGGVSNIGVDAECVLEKGVEDEIWEHRLDAFEVQERTPSSIFAIWIGTLYLEGDFRLVEYEGQKTLVIHAVDFAIRMGKGGVLEYIWHRK